MNDSGPNDWQRQAQGTTSVAIGDVRSIRGYAMRGRIRALFDGPPAVAVIDCGPFYRRHAVMVEELAP